MGDLTQRGVGLRVLAGEGAAIDTTTANGRLMFGFFAALAEFERELIVERIKAGLASARARNGGRPCARIAASWMAYVYQPAITGALACNDRAFLAHILWSYLVPPTHNGCLGAYLA